ncbi:MAG: glycosyltransferase family 4 protein [Bacteroidales bacterium]|nr:glycosyltransferase family 4 protein [Bacteroidales bacterium]
MKTILYFHQSAELYGSDKTLLQLVIGMSKKGHKVIVIVPEEGPLTGEFQNFNIKYIVSPVLKLSRDMFTLKKLSLFVYHFFSSTKTIRRETKNLNIDCIHSNTLAVLLGAFYAKLFRIKHLWHVHEIIESPILANKLYRFLVNSFSSKVVFNSKASFTSLIRDNKNLRAKSSIIYNGIEKPDKLYSLEEINHFKKEEMNLASDTLVIGVVGRISRWKGQILLLEAFEKLQKETSGVYLLIVGSPPPGQEHYLLDLKDHIIAKGLESHVQIHPFNTEIWKYWSSIDIAVVPSTEPEPFGLVAIEAMLMGKPVVAAAHGGLTEIIEDKKTGWLFKPNDKNNLYAGLKQLTKDKTLRNKLGKNAKIDVEKRFSKEKYVQNFSKLYKSM